MHNDQQNLVIISKTPHRWEHGWNTSEHEWEIENTNGTRVNRNGTRMGNK